MNASTYLTGTFLTYNLSILDFKFALSSFRAVTKVPYNLSILDFKSISDFQACNTGIAYNLSILDFKYGGNQHCLNNLQLIIYPYWILNFLSAVQGAYLA